jgi:hypothetical protein
MSTAPRDATDRSHWPVVKGRLAELEGDEVDLFETTTYAERFDMMWQLAQDAWAFRGEVVDDPKLSRYPVRVIRLGE